MFNLNQELKQECDVVLVGAGIMSATLCVFLKELQPDLSIHIYERLETIAAESSEAWNNAGTGHSALCELNYTPQNENGEIEIKKAIQIMESFEVSKQFWAYLVEQGSLELPHTFINPIPHCSFVVGEEDVDFLRKRFNALQACHLFDGMQYSENFKEISKWFPLITTGRDQTEKIAATKIDIGTDINFGVLTRQIFGYLQEKHGVKLFLNHEVKDLKQNSDSSWTIKIENESLEQDLSVTTKFVFIGAGGGSLKLLEDSEIDESEGYGGFPVSGQWLVCKNKSVSSLHHAKVYGKAKVGAPPMSVPHLDTRIINGNVELLFGPFAGFSTKFLKNGSYLDLASSITTDNILPMLSAGIHNMGLTKYLIEQVLQSFEDKMDTLREFVPNAQNDDWELAIAGQRVQIIKKDNEEGGKLEFGTEIIASADGTLAALLGASPGASTSVSIMLDLLALCFSDQLKTKAWQEKISRIIPSHGQSLAKNQALAKAVRANTEKTLDLDKH